MKPYLIDLFAGGGGASRGLHVAGFKHLAAVERDPTACDTLRCFLGYGGVVRQEDIEAPGVIESLPRIPTGLLWASPPCQLHSRANSRRRHEAFDGWPATLAAIAHTRPRAVLVENVYAAEDVALREWKPAVEALGYAVEVIAVNASAFGVAQTRWRIILAAHASAEALAAFVAAVHARETPAPSLREALPSLARCTSGPRNRCPHCDEVVYPVGVGRSGSQPHRLDRPAPTVMTTEVKGTRASERSGWTFNGGPDRASDAAFLAVGRRRLTVAECAILQGFHPGIFFAGTSAQVYAQIGNAVPPPLATALGLAALDTLF